MWKEELSENVGVGGIEDIVLRGKIVSWNMTSLETNVFGVKIV